MWWFLVILGVLIAMAGLSVIALGVSIFVSTFGNTLITTGAVAASGGFVITAMGLVLRQLERLSARIEESLGMVDAAGRAHEEALAEAPEPQPAPFSPPRPRAAAPRLSAEDLLPRPDEMAEEEPEPGFEPLPERAPGRLRPPPAPPLREERPLEEAAPDPMVEARRQRLERRAEPEPRPAPRLRPEPAAPRGAPLPRPAPPASGRRAEGEEPRILKSGIVGGMAYTLYSDGSIQADLPDGVVRFASLQELRDHVANAQQGH